MKVRLLNDRGEFYGEIKDEETYNEIKKGSMVFTKKDIIKHYKIPASVFERLLEQDKRLSWQEKYLTAGCDFCTYGDVDEKNNPRRYPREELKDYKFYAGYSCQVDVDDFDECEIEELHYCPKCGRRLIEHKGTNGNE